MKTNRGNNLAQLGLAAVSILAASGSATLVNAAQLLAPTSMPAV